MKYAIATVGNDGYMPFMKRMLHTFIQSNKWFEGDILVLYNSTHTPLSVDSQKILKDISSGVQCIDVPDTVVYQRIRDRFKEVLHVAKRDRLVHTIWEFEIFKMKQYDKVLFLDGDLLIMKNIKELFNFTNFGAPWIVCRDQPLNPNNDRMVRYNGEYINSGVMMIQPNRLPTSIFDDLMNTAMTMKLDNKRGHGIYFDQDIINRYMYDHDIHVLVISNRYNCWSRSFLGAIDKNDWVLPSDIKIIHYIDKPYTQADCKKIDDLWQNILS